MYNVYYTIYTMYTVHCIMYNVQCALYIMYSLFQFAKRVIIVRVTLYESFVIQYYIVLFHFPVAVTKWCVYSPLTSQLYNGDSLRRSVYVIHR